MSGPANSQNSVEEEEERLERRLREIMGDTEVRGMPNIEINPPSRQEEESTQEREARPKRLFKDSSTTSPIQESDMVKHYKSLFFARNRTNQQETAQSADDTNGYTRRSFDKDRTEKQPMWTSKYKTNIVPPHMKRPKHVPKSTTNGKLHSSFMSSLPPEQIPSYFSAPALARMKPKRLNVESKEEEAKSRVEGSNDLNEERGTKDEETKSSKEDVVSKEEHQKICLELEEVKERLKLYQDQSDTIQELEAQIADLNETKLDAKGMSVSLQRQLTQLTSERQDMLLELRDTRQQIEEYQEKLHQKDELSKILKQKAKLLESKVLKLERELVEVKTEVEAEREAFANSMQSDTLKDAMQRIAELEALNHVLRECISQREE